MAHRHCDQPFWLIYSLGGGMGHFTRSLALARHAARNGVRTRILGNSPFLSGLLSKQLQPLITLSPLIEIAAIPSSLGREAVHDLVRQELEQLGQADVLVVDTFPRGIGGELADQLQKVPGFKVLIHRDLNPEYIRFAKLEATVLQYDLIVVPGESAPFENLAHARTARWMICDAAELLSRSDARRFFGVDADNDLPLIVLSGCGTQEEAMGMAQFCEQLKCEFEKRAIFRLATLDSAALAAGGSSGCSPWPLLMAMNGIDLLIGSGGYNTVHEARATGTPFLGFPQKRLYDRQSRRLSSRECIQDQCDLRTKIEEMLSASDLNAIRPHPVYTNGAAEAFDRVNSQVVVFLTADIFKPMTWVGRTD